uniref:X-ray repair complementing defective repair in Chinese hamster cells 3 n=1 Tax=Callorhinchus milii TaxID=7868 RepID=V9KPM9_CALMI
MDWDQLVLNPKVVAAVRRANIQSIKEILSLSGPDLQRLTKLSLTDVQHLHKTVAAAVKTNPVVTVLQIYKGECPFPTQNQRLSLGCPVLDLLLGGGIPHMGITEIAGESSAGKTQICMQLCLCVQYPCSYGGQEAGALYICTEDIFPNKRLQQLIDHQHTLRSDVPADIIKKIRFSDNIFIEHATDVDALNNCISKKLPILLSRGLVHLVVIDSIAALFRCEFAVSDSIVKAKCLQKFGATLHHLSTRFRTPIVCVNQVTDALSDSALPQSNLGLLNRKVMPSLGLTWSNQLLMRLMVSRTHLHVEDKFPGISVPASCSGAILRTMEILFAPHLPQLFCYYVVSKEGVRGLKEDVL